MAHPGKRKGKEQLDERRARVESMLAVRYRTAEITAEIVRDYGVHRSTVDSDIKAVRDRWREEAEENGDREKRRDELRQSLNEAHKAALTRSEIARDSDGNPLLDDDGKIIRVGKPDPKGAVAAARVLMQLDGLDAPKKTEIKLDGAVGVEVSINRATLKSWLGGNGKKG